MRIYRYVVPIDAADHPVMIDVGSEVVAVAAIERDDLPDAVEFWAPHHTDEDCRRRTYRVFGTGQDVPRGARHVGTCARTPSGLVWHLFDTTVA